MSRVLWVHILLTQHSGLLVLKPFNRSGSEVWGSCGASNLGAALHHIGSVCGKTRPGRWDGARSELARSPQAGGGGGLCRGLGVYLGVGVTVFL